MRFSIAEAAPEPPKRGRLVWLLNLAIPLAAALCIATVVLGGLWLSQPHSRPVAAAK